MSSKNAEATLTTRDDGKFVRTAVQLKDKDITSIDVLRPDGTLLARVNLLAWDAKQENGKASPKGGTVDVILQGEQRGRFLAWNKGVPQVDAETVSGTTVHSVGIKG